MFIVQSRSCGATTVTRQRVTFLSFSVSFGDHKIFRRDAADAAILFDIIQSHYLSGISLSSWESYHNGLEVARDYWKAD